MTTDLTTGKHYWFRQQHEKIWRVGYVGEDPDGNKWLHYIGIPPMEVNKMNLLFFDIKPCPNPAGATK